MDRKLQAEKTIFLKQEGNKERKKVESKVKQRNAGDKKKIEEWWMDRIGKWVRRPKLVETKGERERSRQRQMDRVNRGNREGEMTASDRPL